MTASANIANFKTAHATVWGWMDAEAENSDFAASLKSAIARYGSLTERQLAAAEKCAIKRAVKLAEFPAIDNEFAALFAGVMIDTTATQPAPKAPAIKTDKLTAAFDIAKSKGIQRPTMRFDGFKASPAPEYGKNPGAIYIKADGEYAGKITREGEFFPARDCPIDMRAKIEAAMIDPLAQAVAYGRKTGQCSCCGRLLENKISVELGIGPICRDKFWI